MSIFSKETKNRSVSINYLNKVFSKWKSLLSLVPADTQATPSRGCRGEPYTGHGARRRRRRREKGTRAYARARAHDAPLAVHLSSRLRSSPASSAATHARTYLVLRFCTTRSTVISSSSTKSPMPTSSVFAISLYFTRAHATLTAHTQIHQVNSHDQPPRATDPRALTVGWLACSLHRRPTSLSRVAILHGECGHLQTLPLLRFDWSMMTRCGSCNTVHTSGMIFVL